MRLIHGRCCCWHLQGKHETNKFVFFKNLDKWRENNVWMRGLYFVGYKLSHFVCCNKKGCHPRVRGYSDRWKYIDYMQYILIWSCPFWWYLIDVSLHSQHILVSNLTLLTLGHGPWQNRIWTICVSYVGLGIPSMAAYTLSKLSVSAAALLAKSETETVRYIRQSSCSTQRYN